MIISELRDIESGEKTLPSEDVEQRLRQRLDPEKFDDKLDALAAEPVRLLCRQIAQCNDLGTRQIELTITGPYSLGYLSGFSMGYLEATGFGDERIKIIVLQIVIDMVLGEGGKEAFERVREYLATGEDSYKEGLRNGFREVVHCVELDKEPTRLTAHLRNN
ncbi:MAG: hypothetical protein KC553_06765 [Nitrospina sp.]|nr:hypothetical protein [Nitrospina sp.]